MTVWLLEEMVPEPVPLVKSALKVAEISQITGVVASPNELAGIVKHAESGC